MKKHVSLALVIILLAGFAPAAAVPALAADPGPSADVIVNASTAGAAINLTAETITLPGFTVKAYSLDGGTRWKKGPLPTGDKFKKLFNKDLTLWLSDAWIDKAVKADPARNIEAVAKGVPDSAAIIRFPAIDKRPKKNAEKLKPYYGNEKWVLAKKNETTATFAGYEYAPSSDGKTPTGSWLPMPEDGIAVISGKAKATYLIRSAPNSTTPASAPFKVKPANLGKAPNYTMGRKKDQANNLVAIVTLKKGDSYALGTAVSVDGPYSEALTDKTELIANNLAASGSTTLYVRKAATGKKPASEVQKIDLTKLPTAMRNVLVTVSSSVSGVTYKCSQSSPADAAKGYTFPANGFKLAVGASLYVCAEWKDNGVKKTQTLGYKAIETDMAEGKTLVFNDWVIDSLVIAAEAQPVPGATSITVTGYGIKSTAVFSDFTIGGEQAGKVTGVSSVTSGKVIFTTTALAQDDRITIQAKPTAANPTANATSNTVVFSVLGNIPGKQPEAGEIAIFIQGSRYKETAALSDFTIGGGAASKVTGVAGVYGSIIAFATDPLAAGDVITIQPKASAFAPGATPLYNVVTFITTS